MPDNRGPDIDDDALDARLTPPLASAGIDDSRIAELLAAIEADDTLTSTVQGPLKPRRPGRRRAAVIGGGLALAIGIGIASPAAADFVQRFLAQTGDFGSSDPTDEGSSKFGELIEVTAPDFPEYALTIIPEWLPVPDGVDRNTLMEATIDNFAHPDPSNLMLEPGEKAEDVDVVWHRVAIQHEFERVAFIAWLNEWVDAHEVGDNDRAARALQVLNEATIWPAIVATDGGGVVDGMRRLIAAAERGKTDTVARYAEMFDPGEEGHR